MPSIHKRHRATTDPNALVLHSAVPHLNPEVLHEEAQASVHALLTQGQSSNTTRSYAAALRYWAAWFRLRYRATIALPVPVAVVLQFVVDHVERVAESGARAHDLPPAIDMALVQAGFKRALGAPRLATVLHRLSVLSKAHTVKELPNPVREIQVQELIRRVRRAHAQRGEFSQPKQALTKDPLEAMLATCTDGLIGIRDRALLLFAWASGGRRRGEGTTPTRRCDYLPVSLDPHENRSDGAHSHVEKPIVGLAAEALTAWLQVSGINEGAIFRRIRGTRVAEALNPQAVRYIVKRRAQMAGLTGDFSAHSLRSGFMTEAGRQNVPLAEAMALTGHRSVQTALRYFQTGSVQHTRAAHLLQKSDPHEE